MMEPLFTPEEQQVLGEKRFFEVRMGVEQKLLQLFGLLRDALGKTSAAYAPLYPPGTDYKTGKISKGENYNGYPYRVLDFPRLFAGPNMFACRCMLLWGHHYAFHVLLAGPVVHTLRTRLACRTEQLAQVPLLLATHETPWQWAYAPAHYATIGSLPLDKLQYLLTEAPFLKLSAFWALNDLESYTTQAPALWQNLQPLLFTEM